MKHAVINIEGKKTDNIELSDKICVINEGVLSKIFNVIDITTTDVGLLMGGKIKKSKKMEPIK